MIVDIKDLYREIQFIIKQRIRLENALGAFIRSSLGWSKDLPEEEQKRIKEKAAKIIAEGKDKRFALLIADNLAAMKPLKDREESKIKELERLAKKLPVWKNWAEGVKGFGPKGLGIIVGIAGDLNDWPHLPGLYKRLGLAPYQRVDGVTQAGSTWRMKGGLTGEEWSEYGYSPRNRAAMYAYVGEPIIRQGPYAEEYQRRRAYEDTRTESKMTAHRRAHRYVTKRLIKHLWQAWRRDLNGPVERPFSLCSNAA